VLYAFVLVPSMNGPRPLVGPKNLSNNSAINLLVLAWLTSGEPAQQPPRLSLEHQVQLGRLEFDPSWVVSACS
jgi:hypothetical protein